MIVVMIMIVTMVMTLAKMMMTVKTPPHCGNTGTFEEFRTKVAAIILMTKLSISMIWMCGVNPFFKNPFSYQMDSGVT